MSNLKDSLSGVNGITFDTNFRDNLNEKFSQALVILLKEWVKGGTYSISISISPTNSQNAILFNTIDTSKNDATYTLSSYITNTINNDSKIKELGKFNVSTINKEISFVENTTTQKKETETETKVNNTTTSTTTLQISKSNFQSRQDVEDALWAKGAGNFYGGNVTGDTVVKESKNIILIEEINRIKEIIKNG
jgi:hypothetical protein